MSGFRNNKNFPFAFTDPILFARAKPRLELFSINFMLCLNFLRKFWVPSVELLSIIIISPEIFEKDDKTLSIHI